MSLSDEDLVPPLPQLIAERAGDERTAHRVFLDDLDGVPVTYAELQAGVEQWAAAFAREGVGPGDRVLVMLGNSPTAAMVWLALAWIGAVEAPLNTAYRGRMLADLVEDTGADLMVLESKYVERIEQVADRLTLLRRLVVDGPGESVRFDSVAVTAFTADAPKVDLGDGPRPQDVATIIYTSGTTGPSKGVLVPWGLLRATALGGWPTGDLNEDDAFYSPLPQYHSSGKNPIYMMALCGGRVVLRRRFKTDRFIEDVNSSGATTTLLLGAMVTFLEQQEPAASDRDISLTNVLMAPLPQNLQAFVDRFGVRVCTGYSMTEISSPITTMGWNPTNRVSCGRVRPGYQVRVVDDSDNEVGPGVPGELIVRADRPWTLMTGYWGRPDATLEAWRNLWFHTGDLFSYDDGGQYYFLDRKKDSIRRRGENISSYEIEREVNGHPHVLESAAVAVASDLSEDDVCVYVVLRPGRTVSPEELMDFLTPRLPHFMVPRYVSFLAELPKTPTQKVQKAELRARHLGSDSWDREAHGYRVTRTH